MSWFNPSRYISAVVAVVLALSWIAASNHCSMALLLAHRSASQAACPEHAKHSEQGGMLACCQGLLSPASALAKVKVAVQLVLLAVQSFGFDQLLLPRSSSQICASSEYDTGPPAMRSFAEKILQCSLLVNAPPSVV